jgi:DNA polymerase-1
MFDLDKIVVGDVETDALDGYTKVHCCVFNTMDGTEYVFEEPSRLPWVARDMRDFLHEYNTVAGHHFIQFDYDALQDLLPGTLTHHKILDTLVMGRLVNYSRPGGHSIAAYGESFGVRKEGKDIKDFSVYTEEMLRRCKSDVVINRRILESQMRFLKDKSWEQAIGIEHFVEWQCRRMRKHGLEFDTEAAKGLYDDLATRLAPIDESLLQAFPPVFKEIKYVTPVRTKSGTLHSKDFRWAATHEYTYDKSKGVVTLGDRVPDRVADLSDFDGTPFSLGELIPFNPGSPSQIVTRLNESGWKPTEKTKGHTDFIKNRRFFKGTKDEYQQRLHDFQAIGWKVSETNLLTLPDSAPRAARQLAERITIASRVSDVEEWLALVANDGRLHPYLSGIGAWTQRLAHSKPNSANIPVAKRSPRDTEFVSWVNDINDRMRALFIAPRGYRLLGTDADGIQMRIFAHLVGDERLIQALVSGDKSNGTDIHSVHQRALGSVCKSRDAAKTFIYAFLLGAGISKVAEILECSVNQAKEAVNSFLAFYPGLKELKQERIPRDAERGYFIGLDGRKVICSSEHLMLSGYLQNGEKIIMSYALREWLSKVELLQLPVELLNWVHDEWQTLIPDDNDLAKTVTDIQIQALRDTTDILKLKCPMEGTTSKHANDDGTIFYGGYSWKETH